MAKITGDVRLSIQDAAISGTVFGGSASGVEHQGRDVASSLTSTTQGHTVQGSVFGGGEGSVLEGLQGDDWEKQQRAVGQIGGDASLSVTGYAVGGDVFGGGKAGAVLGKASTVVEGASVAGAGARRRRRLRSGRRQRRLGTADHRRLGGRRRLASNWAVGRT